MQADGELVRVDAARVELGRGQVPEGRPHLGEHSQRGALIGDGAGLVAHAATPGPYLRANSAAVASRSRTSSSVRP